jgi:alpha-tubulin suppressor-like RCC1 family protein
MRKTMKAMGGRANRSAGTGAMRLLDRTGRDVPSAVRVALACVAFGLVPMGCAGESALAWRLVLAPEVDPEAVVFVEAEVRTACEAGTSLWRGAADADGEVDGSPAVPRLAAGTYALVGRAYDRDCALVAEGCVAFTAPRSGEIEVRLDAVPPEPVEVCPDGHPRLTPVFVDLSAGSSHTCVLDHEGQVWCWGHASAIGAPHTYASCGGPSTAEVAIARVEGLPPATSVAAGGAHTCAVTRDGEVWCWGGTNEHGELGQDEPFPGCDAPLGCGRCTGAPIRVPLPTDSGLRARGVAAGERHSCAILEDAAGARQVWCWGNNDRAQLGARSDDGPLPNVDGLPPALLPAPGAGEFQRLDAEGDTTCGIDHNGIIWCWGSNDAAQVTYGAPGPGVQTIPFRIGPGIPGYEPTLPVSVGVAVGRTHACRISAEGGAVHCWGEQNDGQLGNFATAEPGATCDETWSSRAMYSSVGSGYAPVAELSLGTRVGDEMPVCNEGFSCLRGPDGAVVCWGANRDGQCGAEPSERSDGVAVEMPPGVEGTAARIAAGAAHACALVGDRAEHVVCWGDPEAFGAVEGSFPRPTRILIPVR